MPTDTELTLTVAEYFWLRPSYWSFLLFPIPFDAIAFHGHAVDRDTN